MIHSIVEYTSDGILDKISMAGVALGDIDAHFAWQAWRLWHWDGSGGVLVSRGRRGCLCGRCDTWRRRSSFSVAGVALGDIDLHSAWQVWPLATSTFFLRGRCGTYGTGMALVERLCPVVAAGVCVAGVALGDIIYLHSAWQAWHLATLTCILRMRTPDVEEKFSNPIMC